MNKAELVAAVAEQTGQPKTSIAPIVDAVFDVVTQTLVQGDEVKMPNFGSFQVVQTAPRVARNPQTNEEVKVPAGRRARFKPGKALKDALDATQGAATAKR